MSGKPRAFEPVALSLDEHGYAYLIAQVGSRLQYWMVSTDGTRAIQFELPPPLLSLSRPPIIGYDKHVYLTGNGLIMAISFAAIGIGIISMPVAHRELERNPASR